MTATIAEVGARIRERREELEMGRNQLAERAGVPPVAVRAIEDGQVRMRIDELMRLSEALEVHPDYIIDGTRRPTAAYLAELHNRNVWMTAAVLAACCVAIVLLIVFVVPAVTNPPPPR